MPGEKTGAPLRDLLHLGVSGVATRDSSNLGGWSGEPACVLPRERATLVHLGGLKAVIGPSEALFFDADRLDVRYLTKSRTAPQTHSHDSIESASSCVSHHTS